MGEVGAGTRMLAQTTGRWGSEKGLDRPERTLGWLTCLDMESMRRT